jgi:Tol biopolymer transport system component
VLVNIGDAVFTTDWLPDGSAVVFHDFPAFNLYLAPVDGSPPRLWLDAPGAQHRARASPDSRWLAFRSTELGTREIYAAPLTDSGRRIRISTNGAREVVWAPDGRSLFFSDEHAVYEVGIDTEAFRVVGTPRTVLRVEAPDRIDSLDITPDGTRLLLALLDESLLRPSTLVHVGWRRALPTGG